MNKESDRYLINSKLLNNKNNNKEINNIPTQRNKKTYLIIYLKKK